MAHHFGKPLEESLVCHGFFVSHGRRILRDAGPPNDLPENRQRLNGQLGRKLVVFPFVKRDGLTPKHSRSRLLVL